MCQQTSLSRRLAEYLHVCQTPYGVSDIYVNVVMCCETLLQAQRLKLLLTVRKVSAKFSK